MEHFYQTIDGFSDESEQGELLKTITKLITSDNLKIIEIGVYKGRCTAMWNVFLINQNINYNYYAVDHFQGSTEHEKNVDYYNICKNNLVSILDNISLIKNDSESESKNYPDNFFDIIYVDASHDYESVIKDLDLWFPKLKKGGIMCGDDYVMGWPGVVRAVNEFFGTKKINLVGTQQWWVKK